MVGGTIIVPDLKAACGAFERSFAWRVESEGSVPVALARLWGAPASVNCRYALLYPPSGARTWLRLIETRAIAPAALTTQGWSAIEMAVEDVDLAASRLDPAAFRVIGPPRFLSAWNTLRAMQIVGPGESVFYFTQILQDTPPFELPMGAVGIDRIYMAGIGAGDLDGARGFYEERFAVRRLTDHAVPIAIINRAHDLPAETKHRLSTLQLAGRSLLEIDQFPSAAKPRRAPPGDLPPGIAIATFECARDEGERMAFPPYGGAKVSVLRGVAGELAEFIAKPG
jgi:hypothetical protein